MLSQILVLTGNGACIANGDMERRTRYNVNIHVSSHIEEAAQKLKDDHYLLIVVSLNRQNVRLVQSHIKVLRSSTAAPILAVAEESLDVTEKIAVLMAGVDQFIEPPLTTEEAALSIITLINLFRELNILDSSISAYYDHGIIISPNHRKVIIGGREIELIKKEFDILSLLAKNRGIVLTHEQIFANVWGEEYISNSKNTLWNQIHSLRDKVQICPYLPDYIKTVHGIGYSFDPRYNTS